MKKLGLLVENHTCPKYNRLVQNCNENELNGFLPERIHEGLEMNIYALSKHLSKECPQNRSCKSCDTTFKTQDEFKAHLKFCCPAVIIKCQECHQDFSRKEFTLHSCYINMITSTLSNNQSSPPVNK